MTEYRALSPQEIAAKLRMLSHFSDCDRIAIEVSHESALNLAHAIDGGGRLDDYNAADVLAHEIRMTEREIERNRRKTNFVVGLNIAALCLAVIAKLAGWV